MGRLRPLAAVVLALGAAAALAIACGTSAVDTTACRQIETARCQAAVAPVCAINLSEPVHSDNDVTACIRYYDTQCLHGLVTTTVPGNVSVNDCVAAIGAAGQAATQGDAGACLVITNPETSPACGFLVPPDAGTPAVDASDAASDDAAG
jgi:hypothetical protein